MTHPCVKPMIALHKIVTVRCIFCSAPAAIARQRRFPLRQKPLSPAAACRPLPRATDGFRASILSDIQLFIIIARPRAFVNRQFGLFRRQQTKSRANTPCGSNAAPKKAAPADTENRCYASTRRSRTARYGFCGMGTRKLPLKTPGTGVTVISQVSMMSAWYCSCSGRLNSAPTLWLGPA